LHHSSNCAADISVLGLGFESELLIQQFGQNFKAYYCKDDVYTFVFEDKFGASSPSNASEITQFQEGLLASSMTDCVFGFFLCSFAMLSAFWVGNYVAPDWIFSETVFATKTTDKEIANRGDDEADLEILNVTTLEPSPLDIEQYDIEEIESLKDKKLSDIIKERRPLRDAALLGFQAAQQNAKKLRKSKK